MLLFFLMLWLTLVNYFFMKLGIFFVILPCPGCSRIFLVSCAFFSQKIDDPDYCALPCNLQTTCAFFAKKMMIRVLQSFFVTTLFIMFLLF